MFNPRPLARLTGILLAACFLDPSAAGAQTADHGNMPSQPAAPPSVGQSLLERVQSLIGTWDAHTKQGVLTDVFKPFALGTAVLGEEWLNGKQITATIFYVVNGELRADHYCDYLNQPRYTVLPSVDTDSLDFEFRDATNVDAHPVHFHGTKWKLVDSQHLIQDWFVMGGEKPVSQIHLEFTRRAEPAPVKTLAQTKARPLIQA